MQFPWHFSYNNSTIEVGAPHRIVQIPILGEKRRRRSSPRISVCGNRLGTVSTACFFRLAATTFSVGCIENVCAVHLSNACAAKSCFKADYFVGAEEPQKRKESVRLHCQTDSRRHPLSFAVAGCQGNPICPEFFRFRSGYRQNTTR